MTNLFKIDTTDLTPWEKTSEHDANKTEVWEEWTDGNLVTHRVVSRTRVTGKVILNFSRLTDYTAFLTLLFTKRNVNGYYPVSIYCSNTDTLETVNAFLDVSGDTQFDVTAPIKHYSVTISITER